MIDSKQEPPAARSGEVRKKAILIVEDNADNMKLVEWLLEDEGYELIAAYSAEAGFEVLESRQIDLILMDISLPGMSGKDATRRIRADSRFAEIPIAALTAHAVQGEHEAIQKSGVSRLFTKPIDELCRKKLDRITIHSWFRHDFVLVNRRSLGLA